MAGERIPKSIFRTYDIRGIYRVELTETGAWNIGRAIGGEALERGETRIVVGRDGRLSSPSLHAALLSGLRDSGVDVLDVGCVPTPVLYFAAYTYTNGSGVMVTGSHNPPDYNGFKVLLGKETLSGDAILALHQRIERNEFPNGAGSYQSLAVLEDYIGRILAEVSRPLPFKVVVDCGNGAGGVIAPQLLRALGCEVVELFTEVNGNFPNHHPDPSQPENLRDLQEAVLAHGADLGVAYDGDADRLGVVTSEGEIIWPDRLMMLFARDLLGRHGGARIIHDVKCSSLLSRLIRDAGGIPELARTGHSLIKARMLESDALLAGELSGHIFFRERWYGFDDALYATVRLLELLAADARSPRDVFAALPDALVTPELRVSLSAEPEALVRRLAADNDLIDSGTLTTVDGVRVDYADCWGLVRASNTTPCLVLRFEAESEQAMARVQGRFRTALHRLDPELQLPF